MSTVFTLNKSWFNRPALYEQLAFASAGDAIVLIEDAVLALQSPISLASFLAKCERASINVYSLQGDCALRGIQTQYDSIESIDYSGFVTLVTKHDKQVAWS